MKGKCYHCEKTIKSMKGIQITRKDEGFEFLDKDETIYFCDEDCKNFTVTTDGKSGWMWIDGGY